MAKTQTISLLCGLTLLNSCAHYVVTVDECENCNHDQQGAYSAGYKARDEHLSNHQSYLSDHIDHYNKEIEQKQISELLSRMSESNRLKILNQ